MKARGFWKWKEEDGCDGQENVCICMLTNTYIQYIHRHYESQFSMLYLLLLFYFSSTPSILTICNSSSLHHFLPSTSILFYNSALLHRSHPPSHPSFLSNGHAARSHASTFCYPPSPCPSKPFVPGWSDSLPPLPYQAPARSPP